MIALSSWAAKPSSTCADCVSQLLRTTGRPNWGGPFFAPDGSWRNYTWGGAYAQRIFYNITEEFCLIRKITLYKRVGIWYPLCRRKFRQNSEVTPMAIVRRSEKRDAILRLIQQTDCHPSADWVYQQMKDTYPGLSLGTVYRNLKQLSELNIIRRVGVIQGQERFDRETRPHAHFICNRCGLVLDLPDQEPGQGFVQACSEQYGFVVEGHEFNLCGLCADCKKIMKLEELQS